MVTSSSRARRVIAPGAIDQDNDGGIDPGDTLVTRIGLDNVGDAKTTGISVTDTLTGVTIDPSSLQVTQIAFDDALATIMGNTPVIISLQTASSHDFQIGTGPANSGGTIAVSYGGAINAHIGA